MITNRLIDGAVRAAMFAVLLCAPACASQAADAPRTPAETVDAFHAALAAADTAGALTRLGSDLVVFEFGAVDPTVDAYAFQHLPNDIDVAMQTERRIESRQVGGENGVYWVLSTYDVTGTDREGAPIDFILMETAILRRVGDNFRIVHFHWSTDDTAFQVGASQSGRSGEGQ